MSLWRIFSYSWDLQDFIDNLIRKFFQIIMLLTDLIKSAKKEMMYSFFAITVKAIKTFEKLKAVFISAFILKHYDWDTDLCIKINAFNREVKDVLSQKNMINQWYFIAYYSYKFKEAEVWWIMYNKKLYTIVLDFKN